MIEPFTHDFMLRALAAGLILGVLSPLIGCFLVVRRYSLLADCLAHVSLAGVAIGLLSKLNPVFVAMGVSSLMALLIESIRQKKKFLAESLLALFLWGGLAGAVVLISLADGFNVDLFSYLFGSITTVNGGDLIQMVALAIVVGLFVILFYKELFFIALDEDLAFVSGVNTKLLNFFLVLAAAVTVSLSMRAVGVLLVGALMVVPVLTALTLEKGFLSTILWAEFFSALSVILGLLISYHLDIASGGSIVLVLIAFFTGCYLLQQQRT